MKQFKHETIIISKEAWEFMKNFEREVHGYRIFNREWLDKLWSRMYCRNGGANPATHPIKEDEVRVDRDSFNIRFENVKSELTAHGFNYRSDGFVAEGFYL